MEKVFEMNSFLIILTGIVLGIAAVWDLRFQRIPNVVTYPTMLIAMMYHSITHGLDGLFFSAGGLGLGTGILVIPYFMGGMGAGDAKLLGAVGSILGPWGVLTAFLFTALVGGLYALGTLLVIHQPLRAYFSQCTRMVKRSVAVTESVPSFLANIQRKPRLCYGVAIGLGTLLSISYELLGFSSLF